MKKTQFYIINKKKNNKNYLCEKKLRYIFLMIQNKNVLFF